MGVRALIEEMKRVLFICALLFAAALCEDKPDAPADEADDMSGDPKVDGKKEMAEMDTNKDGKATLEEIEALMKTRYYTKAELLKELDKDKSNDLNEAEIIAQYEDTGDMPEDDEGEDAAAEEADGDAMPEEGEDEKK